MKTMKPSIRNKLSILIERYEEISALLSQPEVLENASRFMELSKEYGSLNPLIERFQTYEMLVKSIEENQSLLLDPDVAIRSLAKEEILVLEEQLDSVLFALYQLLLPKDPYDTHNVFLEIRAAAGGDEAAIFAGDLFRMYCRYADMQKWQVEILNESIAEQGGYKNLVARISGKGVYGQLKFESGAHRVQRVPETEAQGRIHTSTCTVAILPELEEIENITINPADLKIDTYRASGAGGQHVNKTDSAIRITHIPSGIVVECQDERSQHKNRARAMSLLQAKLLDQERSLQKTERAEKRRLLVGTGDRSERIRTYNFPQGRITDHRINLTLYKLSVILEGNLEEIIEPLLREYQADLLLGLEGE